MGSLCIDYFVDPADLLKPHGEPDTKKNSTIKRLLAQTRPVTKGPRVRGKSQKCRGRKKSGTEDMQSHSGAFNIAPPLMALGLSSLAATAAAQRASQAKMQASQNQMSFLRQQAAEQMGRNHYLSGLGCGVGEALGGIF